MRCGGALLGYVCYMAHWSDGRAEHVIGARYYIVAGFYCVRVRARVCVFQGVRAVTHARSGGGYFGCTRLDAVPGPISDDG